VIVVDANILIYLEVPGAQTQAAEMVYQRDPDWIAPTLWRSEFRSALVVFMRRRVLTLDQALATAERAERAMDGRELAVDSAPVLKLADISGCSAYDCEYAVLAQELGIPLVTADAELLSKFRAVAVSMQDFCSRP